MKKNKVKTLLFLICFLLLGLFLIFKVKAQPPSSYGWILNYLSKEIEGLAWGDRYLGRLSANCRNFDECGISNYKLMTDIVFPIRATNLRVEWYYCDYDKMPVLKWEVKGGTPFKIWLQVFNAHDSSLVFDSGEITGFPFQFPPSALHWSRYEGQWTPPHPQYGQRYYWKVKVADTESQWSAWTEGPEFALPPYKFPKTAFQWKPSYPGAKEEVQFLNLTPRVTPYPPEEEIEWEWEIPGWGEDVSCVESETCPCSEYPRCFQPKVQFQKVTTKNIKLKATHRLLRDRGLEDLRSGIGCGPGCCQIVRNLTLRYPLPRWKEAVPK